MSAESDSNVDTGTLRVFLVDDHPIVLQGLQELIGEQNDMTVVGVAAGADDALAGLAEDPADVAVVDLSLPGSGGLDLIRRIRSSFSETRVLVLSIHDQNAYVERAFRAGAVGYLTKNEAIEEVVRAIRQVAAGKVFLNETMAASIRRPAAGDDPREPPDEVIARLSDRELEVFRLIGEGRGTREIADKLGRSVKTVEAHREHIKHKLRLRTGSALLQHAIRWVWERSRKG